MTITEFSNQFDVLYNNITSNQAPGLNEYEKSVFLTKAQNEIVKNYFTANSKGNNIGQGFDDSAKRQADFSMLMKTASCGASLLPSAASSVITVIVGSSSARYTVSRIDPRSQVFTFPPDVFIPINETLNVNTKYFQVIPLRFDEYTRLMSKPYKRPLKNQAWRLINTGTITSMEATESLPARNAYIKFVEIITTPEYDDDTLIYSIRYIRKPHPIIVGDLDGLSIDGETDSEECELDPILHEDILQRAVELAKVAWTATGQDNAQMVMAAGQRSE
jgi:hypothetical protein